MGEASSMSTVRGRGESAAEAPATGKAYSRLLRRAGRAAMLLAAAAMLLGPAGEGRPTRYAAKARRADIAGPGMKADATTNWAGYVDMSGPGDPRPVVTSISVAYVVAAAPYPDSAGRGGSALGGRLPAAAAGDTVDFSEWGGLGGNFRRDTTLAQGGTESERIGDSAYYTAWYEYLPSYMVPVYEVRPGDTMYVSIGVVGAGKDSCSILLDDMTSGRVFSITRRYRSSMLSAEAIVEDVGPERRRVPLEGGVSFPFGRGCTGIPCTVTIDGFTGELQSFPHQAQVMALLPAAPLPAFVPTKLGKTGSFSVTYAEGDGGIASGK